MAFLATLLVVFFTLQGTSWCVPAAGPCILEALEVDDGMDGFVLDGPEYDLSGYSVSSAGDVNGDGLADIVIGAYRPNLDNSRTYVVYGSRNRSNTFSLSRLMTGNGSDGFVLDGDRGMDNNEVSVSSAGDVNGDGLADFVISAPNFFEGEARIYVVYGSRHRNSHFLNLAGLKTGNGSDGFVLDGGHHSVSSAGDVNGDGLADVVLGSDLGRTYVVYGSRHRSGTLDLNSLMTGNGSDCLVLHGEFMYRGYSVSSAGDVNGDGLSDIVISTNRKYGSRIYVVYGSRNRGDTFYLASLMAGNGSDGFVLDVENFHGSGYSVSSAGDVNGDGLADFLIVASTSSRRTDNAASSLRTDNAASRTYVVYGSRNRSNTFNLTSLMTGNGSDGFVLNGESKYKNNEVSVSSAGDVNGDGLADILIGASIFRFGGASRIYVVYGSRHRNSHFLNLADLKTGNGSDGFVLDGEMRDKDDNNKVSVSSAGDVNGDGLTDFLIGDSNVGYDRGGRTYVIFGVSSYTSVPTAEL